MLKLEAIEILRKVWGYQTFRTGQQEIVQELLAGNDVFAVLPTGGGKSICYQVPGLMKEGLTLVISPLIALMKDQVENLKRKGIQAEAIHSGLRQTEIDQILTNAEFGMYKFLYVSPERLKTELFQARISRLSIAILAIDEAHCVSDWGEYFRPAYREIKEIKPLLGTPPIIAVTATATQKVQQDILQYLGLVAPIEIKTGFDRPNLRWAVYKTISKEAKIIEILTAITGTAIIYASTRNRVEQLAHWLQGEGISAIGYHAGLSTQEREKAQEQWLANKKRVMVATNAFGMGIDKPDVRVVIHADLPPTIEAYYQEAGRAGRDQEKAYAVLLWEEGDILLQQSLIEEGYPNKKELQTVYDTCLNVNSVPIGALPEEALIFDSGKIASQAGISTLKLKHCLDILTQQEVFERYPLRKNATQIRFKQPVEALRSYAQKLSNKALSGFILNLIRAIHADAFRIWYEVDLVLLSRKTGLPKERVLKGLEFLSNLDLLAYQNPEMGERIFLLSPRTQKLNLEDIHIQRAKKRAKQRLAAMSNYAKGIICRRFFLLTYFGEKTKDRCGRCDVCLGKHKQKIITPADEQALKSLLDAIESNSSLEAWKETHSFETNYVQEMLRWLFHEGFIKSKDVFENSFQLTPLGLKKLTQ